MFSPRQFYAVKSDPSSLRVFPPHHPSGLELLRYTHVHTTTHIRTSESVLLKKGPIFMQVLLLITKRRNAKFARSLARYLDASCCRRKKQNMLSIYRPWSSFLFVSSGEGKGMQTETSGKTKTTAKGPPSQSKVQRRRRKANRQTQSIERIRRKRNRQTKSIGETKQSLEEPKQAKYTQANQRNHRGKEVAA